MTPRQKLYSCRKCGLVYDALVNNGYCQAIISVGTGFVGDLAGKAFSVRCGGDIKPLGWKPPEKDERQIDIEQAIGESETRRSEPNEEEERKRLMLETWDDKK